MVADVTPLNGRSEYQKVTRAGIALVFGGQEFSVRPRTIAKDEEWMDLVRERLLGVIGDLELENLTSLILLASSTTATIIELVRAYGESEPINPLPDLDWMRNNATSQEVQDGFVTLLEHAFPPLGMSRRLIPTEQRANLIGALVQLVVDYLPNLAEMARIGRAAREASPLAPSTKSPSRNGTPRRNRSGRR